ncbi:RHS repeat-associated core domain-containing protein [Pseudomonas ogarae]|uniref:RHS repeat-associated core domain-containing protein n=1 Tax=Pseudomonas ogarae (strain DSM 112162 / CECT 30235 / F113) TaxID=1114970 RepID=UPI000AB87538|nr:RHS repeat-associated core domain-containing protein [Pseudomonas ogarae]
MSTSSMKILCRYQYDPLDRLTGLRPAEHVGTQRFYQTDDLVNEIEGQIQLTILRHEAQPLAQRLSIANVAETTLLATDQQHSVLQTLTATDTRRLVYTAYGHQPAESGLSSLLGFNGERPDPITGHYLLGQGNRAFNPVLMRFNSPDEFSPFGDGGINPYAYCGGDPVNRYDPSGNIPSPTRAPMLRNSVIVRKSVIVGPTQRPYKPKTDWSQRYVEPPIKKLPPEPPPKGRRVAVNLEEELKYQTSQRIYREKLDANALLYDRVVSVENPIPADPKLQKKFDKLTNEIDTLEEIKKIRKDEKNETSEKRLRKLKWKVPQVRKLAKQSALKISGVIGKQKK